MSDGGGRLPDGGPAPPSFLCRLVETLPDASVFSLEGDIDRSAAASLHDALAAAAARGRHLILDLRGVRYVDATAYQVLAGIRERRAWPGQRVILVEIPAAIREVIDALGLRRVAEIEPSVDDAKRSLKIA